MLQQQYRLKDTGGHLLLPDLCSQLHQGGLLQPVSHAGLILQIIPSQRDSWSTHLGYCQLLLRLCQGERGLLQQLHGWSQLQQLYAAILAA